MTAEAAETCLRPGAFLEQPHPMTDLWTRVLVTLASTQTTLDDFPALTLPVG